MKIHLAVDSGAFSLFRKRVGAERVSGSSVSAKIAGLRRKDSDFFDSDEFTQYLVDYVAYVKKHTKLLEFYVTVDAMFDPKRTWDILLRLEKMGIKPLPVFHYGEGKEHYAWLKKLMDRYDYIGMGGIARGMGTPRRYAFLRKAFALMVDKHGKPKWKTHGFGVTAAEVMQAFPWYSVDSFSALTMALNGRMQLPTVETKNGSVVRFHFDRLGSNISVSRRRQHDQGSYSKLGTRARHTVDAYLESIGTTFELVCDSDKERIFASYYFYSKMALELSETRPTHDPLRLYFAGSIDKWLYPLLPRLTAVGIPDFRVLGSFFTDQKFINLFPNGKIPNEKSSPRVCVEARQSVPG